MAPGVGGFRWGRFGGGTEVGYGSFVLVFAMFFFVETWWSFIVVLKVLFVGSPGGIKGLFLLGFADLVKPCQKATSRNFLKLFNKAS